MIFVRNGKEAPRKRRIRRLKRKAKLPPKRLHGFASYLGNVHSEPLDHFLADLRATRQVDHPKPLRKESLIDAINCSTTRYGREDGICCNVRCCAAYNDDAEDTNVLVFRVKATLGGLNIRVEFDGSRLSTNARTESQSTVEHPSKFRHSRPAQTQP